jgi:hypothetical protein
MQQFCTAWQIMLHSQHSVWPQQNIEEKNLNWISIFSNVKDDIVTVYKVSSACIKDEDMLLPEEEPYSADDIEMLSAEDSDDHVLPFAFLT